MKTSKKGVLFVEFLFVFVISLLMIIYFFLLSMTFVQIEVAQYIAFKTAREYFLGNQNPGDQKDSAIIKFDLLKNGSSSSAALFLDAPNWWDLEAPQFGSYSGSYSADPQKDKGFFEGVELKLVSKVIHAKIPYIGGTPQDETFKITSFLGREPTVEDCEDFFHSKIYEIKSWYSSTIPALTIPDQTGGDNGC